MVKVWWFILVITYWIKLAAARQEKCERKQNKTQSALWATADARRTTKSDQHFSLDPIMCRACRSKSCFPMKTANEFASGCDAGRSVNRSSDANRFDVGAWEIRSWFSQREQRQETTVQALFLLNRAADKYLAKHIHYLTLHTAGCCFYVLLSFCCCQSEFSSLPSRAQERKSVNNPRHPTPIRR